MAQLNTDSTAEDLRPSTETETRTFTLPLNRSGGSYVDDVWFAWTATYIDPAKPDEMSTVSNVISYRPDAKILHVTDLPEGASVDDLVAMEQWYGHVRSTPETPDNAQLAVTTAIRLDDFHIIPKGLPLHHLGSDGTVTEYFSGATPTDEAE